MNANTNSLRSPCSSLSCDRCTQERSNAADRIEQLEAALRELLHSADGLQLSVSHMNRLRDQTRHPDVAMCLVRVRTDVDKARALIGEA